MDQVVVEKVRKGTCLVHFRVKIEQSDGEYDLERSGKRVEYIDSKGERSSESIIIKTKHGVIIIERIIFDIIKIDEGTVRSNIKIIVGRVITFGNQKCSQATHNKLWSIENQ